MLNRNDKHEIIEKLRSRLQNSKGTFLTDYKGMTVEQSTELRNRCRAAGVEYWVVKNTLARRAFGEDVATGLGESLTGQTAIATSDKDEVTPAKVISEFIKEFEKPEFKAGVVDGRVISHAQIKVLSELPSKDVLLGKFLGSLKAPAQKLHTALSSPMRSLAMVLKQVAEKEA